jgi:hypothetical protein
MFDLNSTCPTKSVQNSWLVGLMETHIQESSSEVFFFVQKEIKSQGLVRDRPFNLKGGVMVFCFVQHFFFRTTQELEYLFFLLNKSQIFFPEFNIRLYDKNSTKIRIFFSSNNGNQYFFRKKP